MFCADIHQNYHLIIEFIEFILLPFIIILLDNKVRCLIFFKYFELIFISKSIIYFYFFLIFIYFQYVVKTIIIFMQKCLIFINLLLLQIPKFINYLQSSVTNSCFKNY